MIFRPKPLLCGVTFSCVYRILATADGDIADLSADAESQLDTLMGQAGGVSGSEGTRW